MFKILTWDGEGIKIPLALPCLKNLRNSLVSLWWSTLTSSWEQPLSLVLDSVNHLAGLR